MGDEERAEPLSLTKQKYEEIILNDSYQAIREWIRLRLSLTTVIGAAVASMTAIAFQDKQPFLLSIAAGLLIVFLVADILLRLYVVPYIYTSWQIERTSAYGITGPTHATMMWHRNGERIIGAFKAVSEADGARSGQIIRRQFLWPFGYASRVVHLLVLSAAIALLGLSYLLA